MQAAGASWAPRCLRDGMPDLIAQLLKCSCSSHSCRRVSQETATTCRERCGGQGYLSVNRFGNIIGFAHAGITAEGDNRVLMQKVAKEYTASASSPAVAERLAAASRPLNLSAGETALQAAPAMKAQQAHHGSAG